jgi:hypothetical protein
MGGLPARQHPFLQVLQSVVPFIFSASERLAEAGCSLLGGLIGPSARRATLRIALKCIFMTFSEWAAGVGAFPHAVTPPVYRSASPRLHARSNRS